MARRGQGATLVADVYDRLRADILNCRLQPGERLKPAELREQFGVSIGVVREALTQLAAKQLVITEPNHGYHVTTVSEEALEHLLYVRTLNECAALRLSIAHGDVGWESEVLAAHHRMASLPYSLPGALRARNEEWARAHVAFHLKLLDACGNDMLLGICQSLSDAAELYRAWSASLTTETDRDVPAEHRALMDAAIAHDADLASDLLAQHIERTARIVLDASAARRAEAAPAARDGSAGA